MAYALYLYVAGETVTAANLNQSTYHNWAVSAVGVVSAGGDMVYASAANAMARLAKGSARQSLEMNAGATAPSWGPVRPVAGHYMGAVASDLHVERGTTGSLAQYAEQSFSFANAFASNPVVVIGQSLSGSNVYYKSLGTTGVTLRNDSGSGAQVLQFIAVGAD